MFRKILVANRGEIAVRILRACKQLGIKTVAVYSEADKSLLHVKFADESICIGPPPAGKSYLNIPNIISAALITHADAIHPGYGFLSENTQFGEICHSHGIRFIGPSPEAVRLLGDKAAARSLAERLHVPIIPGTSALKSVAEARKAASHIGYPVMIKASAGGGGKGMRLVYTNEELEKNFPIAQGEAEAAFGNGELYLEKYLTEPRHIEVQILGDSFGNIVAVGERECSLQRKHQKVIEETPSVVVTPDIRKKLFDYAVKIGKGVKYEGAGTIEFLRNSDGKYYFIEANARIQVEHPITEMVTGLDLLQHQILAASGEKLPFKTEEIQLRGHAIECRITAEDPQTFAPSTGTIERLHWPGGFGIRVDSHLRQGDKISPFYDSLVGKLIAWGSDRPTAIARMLTALEECEIIGIKTNLSLHRQLLSNPSVQAGKMHVTLLENELLQHV